MIAHLGIVSANSRPAFALGVPSMRQTLLGWMQKLILVRVQKTVKDFEEIEAFTEMVCSGVIQPFSAQEVSLLPEGQRSWRWSWLHTTPDVALRTDEVFKIAGIQYRVKGKTDYSDYGMIDYHLVQDYDGGNL